MSQSNYQPCPYRSKLEEVKDHLIEIDRHRVSIR